MSLSAGAITFRPLTESNADLALLERIYNDIYVAEFPDPDERESLENMRRYLSLKAAGWYGKNNYHIIAALVGETPVGLVVLDYLEEPNCGIIEFLTVSPNHRSGGMGTRALAETESILTIDAKNTGRRALDYILAEMNDPFAPNSLNDNLDPFLRAQIWGHWGYRKLQFPYVQPALSPEQKSVGNLLLMAKPVGFEAADTMPTDTLLSALRGYMKWAMRIENPGQNKDYLAMEEYLRSRPEVGMLPLGDYVGRNPDRPLTVREITDPQDQDLTAALDVYRSAFPGSATDISPVEIIDLLSRDPGAPTWRYHFWALQSDPKAPIEGVASFFSFESAGFGGYVTLAGALRGTRRFGLLLARMEEAIRRDAPSARGLYLECDPSKEAYFAKFGFRTLALKYLQPPLRPIAGGGIEHAPPLKLMYKTLGSDFAQPVLTAKQFLSDLSEIFGVVYGICDFASHEFFQTMQVEVSAWPDEKAKFVRQ